jgi:inosine-uridine nucleoside N-ribohydrolase
MVPLEVTHQALATEQIIARLRASNRHVAMVVADLLLFFAATYRDVFGFEAPPVHDPCAVAVVIDPTIVSVRELHVEIETASQWCDGRTVCDVYGTQRREPNASVGYGLDVERFWNLLIEMILTYD